MTELIVTTEDDASLWVSLEGDGGLPIVLSHGGPGLWDYLDDLAQGLVDIATVIRWEQRGCGRSSEGSEPHSIGRYIDDLEAIRRVTGFERWVVGGHSWGASLALRYALAHSDVTNALVYLDGSGIGQRWHEAYVTNRERRLGADYERWNELSEIQERSAEQETEFRRLQFSVDFADPERAAALGMTFDRPFEINWVANRAIAREVTALREADLAERCTSLEVPALIVHGAEDIRPPWAVESLADALPHAEVLVLEEVGHVPWLEDPDRFFGALRSFLAAL
jgi:proline iminopeptidase